jgi:translation initiation factor 2 alpha subunit (eIF-2alpha)
MIMVKALKGNMIILGLSDENIERLKKDQPIKFNLQELGLPDYDVFIFTAKDEQAMYQMMKQSINPVTTIIKDSRSDKN